jgi:hypothetical protein
MPEALSEAGRGPENTPETRRETPPGEDAPRRAHCDVDARTVTRVAYRSDDNYRPRAHAAATIQP